MDSLFPVGTRRAYWQQQLRLRYQQARHSDFLRKVVVTFATRILLLGVGMLTGVLITRSLGPEGRGLYAAAVTVGALGVQFGNLGLHASNTYYVAKDRSLLATLLGNSLVVSLGFGGIGALLAWRLFTWWPQLAPVHGMLLVLALIWIPFGLTNLLLQNLLLGIQAINAYNGIELVIKLSTFAVLTLVIGLNLITPPLLLLVNGVMMFLGTLWIGRQLFKSSGLRIGTSRSIFQDGLTYGFKAYLAAFFSYMVLRIDLLMVKQLLGAEATGYYAVAVGMADLILMVPGVVATVLFPKLSAMTDGGLKRQFTQHSAAMIGTIATGLVVVIALLAQPLVTLLYGRDFLPTVPAFLWLMPAVVFMAINTIFMNYFASIGMPPITIYSPALAALLNVLMNWWLIPAMGISGASLSSTISYGLMLIFSISYLYHKAQVNE